VIRIATPALTLLLAHGLAAQEAPPTFKAESQVVMLDIVARDGHDRPVFDLRPDEIQVFEDGQACKVVSFRLVRGLPVESGNAAAPPSPTRGEQADETPTRQPRRAAVRPTVIENAPPPPQPRLLSQRFPQDTWFAV
jgi:hypothetical protein